MTQPYKKKLIEVAIPLEAINAASAREKSIRHGHPSTLHLWWARRPLAACRAVLFAQLVDDPSGYADKLLEDPEIRAKAEANLPDRIAKWEKKQADQKSAALGLPRPTLEDCAAEIERDRLFAIIEDLVKWENSTNEEVLERARAEIRRSCGGVMPPVYDPFSGGGSIPLEAQRLGLPAYGSDLNPVAVMIGKAMIEIPPKFKDLPPIHPGPKERTHYRNAEGLAEDVKYYGEWMRQKAWERIGDLYPQVDLPKEYGGGKATVIAWIWARTVPSPDPAFADVQVPIASSFLLCSKTGKEAWVEPVVDRKAKTISYRIRYGGTKDELSKANEGTKAGRGANFRCPISDTAITMGHVRGHANRHGLGSALIGIVAEGKRGRVYLPPTPEHLHAAKCAEPTWRPSLLISEDRRAFTPPDYGMKSFGELFTNRQLAALNTFSSLLQEVRVEIAGAANISILHGQAGGLRDGGNGAQAYAEAVAVYLAFAIDRAADAWSSQVSWRHSAEASRSTFARQALAIVWDYVELNPFSDSNGNWNDAAIAWIERAIAGLPAKGFGSVTQQDAQRAALPSGAVISSDPPYISKGSSSALSSLWCSSWDRQHGGEV